MEAHGGDRGPQSYGLAYGSGVSERLRSCVFAGSLPQPDAVGEAGSLECGSVVRIELQLREGIVTEARYRAHGCPATLASASETCARVSGRSLLEGASLSERDVCAGIGLVAEKEYTAGIALDALHEALTAALSSAGPDPAPVLLGSEDGILVGMSGGVDSAVAALLTRAQGHKVVGITLRFWNDPRVADERSCCSPENVRRARRVAHGLGIPHVAIDARDVFYKNVVQYFISEYAAGRTPNPCAKCNSRVRLGLLVNVAERLGLAKVATGHYARLTGTPPRLSRGVDRDKDQSYVLAEVSPEILARFVFPLGEMRKSEVRETAARAGLEGHSAPESQEICFVPDDDHRRFLRERLGERQGDIVDTLGLVRGRHTGTYNYTIGQRKGLGIAAAEPLYVIGLDAGARRVIVGTATEGGITALRVRDLTWHGEPSGAPLAVQVRSAGAALPLESLDVEGGCLTATLAAAASGIAAGQTGVIYEGEQVIVAGTIDGTDA